MSLRLLNRKRWNIYNKKKKNLKFSNRTSIIIIMIISSLELTMQNVNEMSLNQKCCDCQQLNTCWDHDFVAPVKCDEHLCFFLFFIYIYRRFTHLLSIHQTDNFKRVQMILMFVFWTNDVQNQIKYTRLM